MIFSFQTDVTFASELKIFWVLRHRIFLRMTTLCDSTISTSAETSFEVVSNLPVNCNVGTINPQPNAPAQLEQVTFVSTCILSIHIIMFPTFLD